MSPIRCSSSLVGSFALAAMLFQVPVASAEVVDAQPGSAMSTRAKATSKRVARHEGRQYGTASFYSKQLSGRKTASGEKYDPTAMTAAHRTLPLGTKVKVVNPKNDKSVVVTVNDRGPVPKNRMLDVSSAAADALGMKKAGVTKVETEVVGKTDLSRNGKPSSDEASH